MESFIINNYYLILGITGFLFVSLLGYYKVHRKKAHNTVMRNIKENDIAEEISIADLEL